MKKINVLIVDDDVLLRQGLRGMLEKEKSVNAVYEAEGEDSFIQQLSSHTIEIILLDIRLKGTNGLQLLKRREFRASTAKVIAVTGLDGIEIIINLLKAGVHGIVYKLDGYDEIHNTINAVLRSESYFPESILKIIRANANRWEEISSVLLSDQEKLLLIAIASGITTKEIAEQFKMSPATTETYRVRLMRKVGVANTAALIAFAYRNGIL